MFQLTKEECLRSQIVTLNEERGKHLKYFPHAFTENGVAMLSSVLRSKTAIDVNIQIMRAFTSMRSLINKNYHLFQRIESLEHHQLLLLRHQADTDNKIDEILTRLENKDNMPIEGLFYEGQIFDAYALISDFVRKAQKQIVLIDNYTDDRVLRVMDKRQEGVNVTIYTNYKHSYISQDLAKHNAQYPRIEVRDCRNIHDRFLIIDETVYLIGGSIKDLGKKIVGFCQMKLHPEDVLKMLK